MEWKCSVLSTGSQGGCCGARLPHLWQVDLGINGGSVGLGPVDWARQRCRISFSPTATSERGVLKTTLFLYVPTMLLFAEKIFDTSMILSSVWN